jgi:hypothetical protein
MTFIFVPGSAWVHIGEALRSFTIFNIQTGHGKQFHTQFQKVTIKESKQTDLTTNIYL